MATHREAATALRHGPAEALFAYWHGLFVCLHLRRPYAALCAAHPTLPADARLQIYSLCLHAYAAPHLLFFQRSNARALGVGRDACVTIPLRALCYVHRRLWNAPHYRSGTWAEDCRKNLRNVALPGTGIALSYVCAYYVVAVAFLWLGVPLAALAAAIVRVDGQRTVPPPRGAPRVSLGRAFVEALLACGHGGHTWFSFWRLNTALASYHALTTADNGYALEDKLTFLQACEREGIAVSPWLRHPRLIVKHRNEEGGLGLMKFDNARTRLAHMPSASASA